MSKIIGRVPEIKQLKDALKNDKSELIAVYGRRRVGKTYLIREYFKKEIIFEISGLYGGKMKDQLSNFSKEFSSRSFKNTALNFNNWFEAFSTLEQFVDSLKTKKKKVIFIDEFPWIATAKSKFLMAFENFWNSYCTKRKDLVVVICGSAASFMIQKIIKNKGGLHNRISRKIRLMPFTLKETSDFLKYRGIKYTEYDILQLYMSLGGVPQYLEKLEKGLSVAQNIDNLCFKKDGILNDEFNQLFSSLFDDSERHLKIIKILSQSNKGVSRNELLKKSKIPSGGDFSLKMEELIESGFVEEYQYYHNKKQLSLYRLSDEYSKFYLKFIDANRNGSDGTWMSLNQTSQYLVWAGFAFESICLKHIKQIKKALGIESIYSTNSCWFNENAQIDLLIDRADNVINIFEIKFSKGPFTIDKKYYENLKNKIFQFQNQTGNKKNVFLTMLTTYGVIKNKYSNELVYNYLKSNILYMN